jgi:putative methyltransferase (TIGR04325 family)
MKFKHLASGLFRHATGLALVDIEKYDISLKVEPQVEEPPLPQPVSIYPTPLKFVPVSSFAEARAQSGTGYNDQRLVGKAHLSRHARIVGMAEYLAPMLAGFSLAAMRKQSSDLIRVLDVGGGTGVFRSQVNTFFEESLRTDWTVLETEAFAKLNSDLNRDDFRYRSSLGSDRYDIALFSGSLQYIENYQDMLRQVNADLLFISRTPLGDQAQPFVQHMTTLGEEFRLPGQILAKDELAAALSSKYSLFATWEAQSHLLNLGVFDSPAMIWRRH